MSEGESATVSSVDTRFGPVQMLLPDASSDYIQAKLARGEVYEPELLDDIVDRLEPGSVVLDVGANIGGHTCYLAAAGHTVVAFEPDAHLVLALQESLAMNGFLERVDVRRCAIGGEPGRGVLLRPDESNLGTQRVERSHAVGSADGHSTPILTLDQQAYPGPVAAIKIDVEGMELEVLRGGATLIALDRPFLYIELLHEADFAAANAWLEERDYCYAATYNYSPTHLFLPRERVSASSPPPILALARRMYRAEATVREVQQQLRLANDKYRDVTARAAETGQSLESAQQVAAEQAARIAVLEPETERHRQRAKHLRADLRVVRQWIRAAQVREETFDELKQVASAQAQQHAAAMGLARAEREALKRRVRAAEASVGLARAELEQRELNATEIASALEARLAAAIAECDALGIETAHLQSRLDRAERIAAEQESRADVLRMEIDWLQREVEAGRRHRATLAALRASRTYRVGVAVREAMRSPRGLIRLPRALLRIARSPDLQHSETHGPERRSTA